MPRQTIQGVDFSYDPISAREIRCLRDRGIGLMVQCLWTARETPPTANANIRRLVEAGVPAELHIFEGGRHGLGLAKENPGMRHWPTLCIEWLQARKILP